MLGSFSLSNVNFLYHVSTCCKCSVNLLLIHRVALKFCENRIQAETQRLTPTYYTVQEPVRGRAGGHGATDHGGEEEERRGGASINLGGLNVGAQRSSF